MSSSSSRTPQSIHSSREPNEQEDLTWLDFLRTAGGTAPADRSPQERRYIQNPYTGERKRRHTEVEHERREPSYSRYIMTSQTQAGSSRDVAMDLASSSPQPPTRQTSAQMPQLSRMAPNPHSTRVATNISFPGVRSRDGDAVLPKWQPDSDVSKCPVCETDFTFWYRKHHCRKCGRVVCSTCSPHRITIPRQYIVQPPFQYLGSDGEEPPRSPDQGRNPALGGGEIVRVCNPCVPDPWTPDASMNRRSSHSHIDANSNLNRPPVPTSRSHEANVQRIRHGFTNTESPDWPDRRDSNYVRQRSHSYQPIPVMNHDPRSQGNIRPPQFEPNMDQYRAARYAAQRLMPHRHTHSTGSTHLSAFPDQHPAFRMGPPPVPSVVPPPPRPRREVKEEDECPVCGNEMPPGDAVREAHIQECIASRFSSTPTQPSHLPPPPTDAPAVASSSSASSSVPQLEGPSGSSAPPPVPTLSRPRATSYRPRGMALYRATEKDCTTEDGEPQECVICFEEFQPGDEMGRMECLCKFHRNCIRQWWDTKGTGSCPTHQLHD